MHIHDNTQPLIFYSNVESYSFIGILVCSVLKELVEMLIEFTLTCGSTCIPGGDWQADRYSYTVNFIQNCSQKCSQVLNVLKQFADG